MEFTDFFDYGSMNDDHQAAVSECAKWIKNTLKDEYTAERLLYQFKIKERKKFNVDDSQFYHMAKQFGFCLLYTSPSPRDKRQSRMPSSA